VYHAVEKQCNADFAHTATNFELNLKDPYSHRIIAISRDLETKGFKMNDAVIVTGAGKYSGRWVIRDRMNKRWKSRIDFLINVDMPQGKWEDVSIEKIN
tara:strand:- start:4081 stop:4377 length:297 start_codon:yes stop_codon:yes gene_type:complete